MLEAGPPLFPRTAEAVGGIEGRPGRGARAPQQARGGQSPSPSRNVLGAEPPGQSLPLCTPPRRHPAVRVASPRRLCRKLGAGRAVTQTEGFLNSGSGSEKLRDGEGEGSGTRLARTPPGGARGRRAWAAPRSRAGAPRCRARTCCRAPAPGPARRWTRGSGRSVLLLLCFLLGRRVEVTKRKDARREETMNCNYKNTGS